MTRSEHEKYVLEAYKKAMRGKAEIEKETALHQIKINKELELKYDTIRNKIYNELTCDEMKIYNDFHNNKNWHMVKGTYGWIFLDRYEKKNSN